MTQALSDLACYLASRHEQIMAAWRKAIKRDPGVSSGEALPRSQLDDHIPAILDAFRERLASAAAVQAQDQGPEHIADAAAHGLKRWQQGYELREVTREWGQLQLCLMDELEQFAASRTGKDSNAIVFARRAWAQMCAEGVSDSVNQYFRLRQIEAEGQVRDLEMALSELRGLDQQRAQLWREAAHDMRGNVGVVLNAAAGLTREDLPDEARERLLGALGRSSGSLQSLLEDVASLARLQAGREQLVIKPYDAATLIREVSGNLQSFMDARGLSFMIDGPAALDVEGDAVKVQRIAQNLLHNACKYTDHGGVTISYGDSRNNDPARWMLCVQDTGPGFAGGPAAPLASAIETATGESGAIDAAPAGKGPECDARNESAPWGAPLPAPHEHGEGIGLSIVKRLCEMLNATIELESVPQHGTTVRVLFPRRYGADGTG
jgi:signal transduction histidine kinase